MTSKPLPEALDEAFRHSRDMEASLGERLESLARAVRTLSPPFADAVDRLVARLQKSGAGQNAPQVGEPMPPFHLPDEAGRVVSLERLLSKGPVAVTFHRGHWCPYCRLIPRPWQRRRPRSRATAARSSRSCLTGNSSLKNSKPSRKRGFPS